MSDTITDTPIEPKPQPRFAGDPSQRIPLKFPVEFEGKIFDTIVVSPVTVAQYNAAVTGGDMRRLPMFKDPAGVQIPIEVLDALSIRDSAKLTEAQVHFFPDAPSQDAEQPSASASGGSSPEQ